jgi:uncharacterized protein
VSAEVLEVTLAEQERLVAALRLRLGAPGPPESVLLIETHISFVLIASEFAYKIKKAVNLGFLDFTTLARRRHFCDEELRLNRRIAPHIYLDVVPIVCTIGQPVLGGDGPVVEVALKMRAFAQEGLWAHRAGQGELEPHHVERLARQLCAFHRSAAPAATDSPFGTPAQVRAPVLDTLNALDALLGPRDRELLADVRAWETREFADVQDSLSRRRSAGCVRECHGDLHLGNVTTIAGEPTPFDCLEFDPELRWTDVMGDVAFMAMDLHAHACPALAHRFVDAYFECSGDYDGARVLRYHIVVRALVRAKVEALRAAPARARLPAYLGVARRASAVAPPVLFVTHGFSGSGKTTWTTGWLEAIGADADRADVQRKRLAELPADARTHSALRAGLYAPAHNATTHARMRDAAHNVLRGGYHAILDATFLQREPRDQARALARELGVRCVILDCHAGAATLRARVLARTQRGGDASEADLAVLDDQLKRHEPLGADERGDLIEVDTEQTWSRDALAGLAARLGLDVADL